MDLAQLYENLQSVSNPTFWETAFVKFYRAFLYADRWQLYLQGVKFTLILTVLALLLGILLGVFTAVVRTAHDQQRPQRRNPVLGFVNALCKLYTTVIRGTPMLVQLLIWAFVVFKTSRNRLLVGFFGLGVNSGAYVAEIVRGGLMSVDPGQMEAGRSLGLSWLESMRFIVIPQAFKNIIPALGNEFITLFKDTSLISAIGGAELLYYAQAVGTKTYDVMFPYLGAAFMYLILVILLSWLQGKLERRLQASDRH